MKLFIIEITTKDKWELCPSIFLVKAESKEEALEMTEEHDSKTHLLSIEEHNMSSKEVIEVQYAIVE